MSLNVYNVDTNLSL